MLSKNQLGFLYMFLSICAFSLMDVIVKWSVEYPIGQVLFFRGFFGIIFYFFIIPRERLHNFYKTKMSKTIEVFIRELSSLRTGRANSNMLDIVKVDVYGQKMPINQLGTITTPEPRTINIQVWDLNNVPLIDSSLKKSELGLNPQIDGQLIRLPIPDLSEERRIEMKKIVKSMGEKCKVSIRNIRRDGNDELKKLLKSKEISEDNEKKFEKIIQEYTDQNIKLIDDKVLSKEKEIMTI